MQAMVMAIKEFRFSLIWAATFLEAPAAKPADFPNRPGYEKLFNLAQRKGEAQGLCPPWPETRAYAHRFWSNYLQVDDPGRVQGGSAWSKAVPLRAKGRLFTAEPNKFPGRIGAEQFIYPFGAALVMTFYGSGSFSGLDWATAVRSAAKSKLSVTFGTAPTEKRSLRGLATEAMRQMRDMYFASTAIPPLTPFTIATVIRGDDVDETVAPPENGDLHRWLFGAASLQNNFETANLANVSLKEKALTLRSGASPGDVVFATRRGRAIWIPSSFAHPADVDENGRILTSQSCYHRNQLYAALQVESLCSLARALTERIKSNPTLPARLDDFGRIAAQTLTDLDTGDKNRTYRSISVHRQIEDNGSASRIKQLRKRYGI